jgi:HlyD family secretion protein
MRVWPGSWRGRITIAAAVIVVAAGAVGFAAWRPDAAPSVATAAITRGDFVEVVQVRGTVEPRKSVIVTGPVDAGELQVLKIAKDGSPVKAGDVVVQFDASTLQRTVQEKQSDLKQAQAQLDQAKANAAIAEDQDAQALLTAQYAVEKAKLDADATDNDITSKVDADKAKLALADAQAKLHQAQVKVDSDHVANQSNFSAQEQKIRKIQGDLDRAARGLQQLEVKAPVDGVVDILPNYRNSSMMGTPPPFRAGDSAWSGAPILRLPDLSSVHFEAMLDESDRGRVALDQHATIRVDAIPDHAYRASVSEVSMVARVDYSSGYPPVKRFDLRLAISDIDDRLRSGMSASARVEVGRLPDVLLVPAPAVFTEDGRPLVYRFDGGAFTPVAVEVIRRDADQAAIRGPVTAGDRVALARPPETAQRGGGQ